MMAPGAPHDRRNVMPGRVFIGELSPARATRLYLLDRCAEDGGWRRTSAALVRWPAEAGRADAIADQQAITSVVLSVADRQ
jgi:hypothetical protein